ncbi:hypothetical protein FJU08_00680 [Martelella alba]|uniref:Uncharacterized protein n=1 Tax=Martelella alba TaxID=2590451 RepID=A0A506UIH2_9HYPH|nr:hypothetical protein [Martelella alba]TPW33117.1 hypothetical protein FJU08_00680 [Martelella alba]
MKPTTRKYGLSICTCNHDAPSLRVIRSPLFNCELAIDINELDLSGDGIADWVLTEVFEYRTGTLFGFDGKPLPVDENVNLTDDLWGADQKRSINRYRDRASKPFRYRLQMRLVWPVLLIHFAREIHRCRTEGCCAQR